MFRRCTVCRHPALPEIDQELLAGTPHRRVAKQHGLSPSAVFRHQTKHLESSPEAEVTEPENLHLAERVVLLEACVESHRQVIVEILQRLSVRT